MNCKEEKEKKEIYAEDRNEVEIEIEIEEDQRRTSRKVEEHKQTEGRGV